MYSTCTVPVYRWSMHCWTSWAYFRVLTIICTHCGPIFMQDYWQCKVWNRNINGANSKSSHIPISSLSDNLMTSVIAVSLVPAWVLIALKIQYYFLGKECIVEPSLTDTARRRTSLLQTKTWMCSKSIILWPKLSLVTCPYVFGNYGQFIK